MLTFPQDIFKNANTLIEAEERAYKEQISRAVEDVLRQNVRFIFLAGPSCSGKSTTANYLVNALREPCPVPAYVVPNPNGCYNACAAF